MEECNAQQRVLAAHPSDRTNLEREMIEHYITARNSKSDVRDHIADDAVGGGQEKNHMHSWVCWLQPRRRNDFRIQDDINVSEGMI